MEDGGNISWSELPPDLTSLILHRLGAIEMLETAQKVCRSWCDVCKEPSMWLKIDMHNLRDFVYDCDPWKMCKMCCHAVGRSRGGLVEIDIWYFGTDELLKYIAERMDFPSPRPLAMEDEGHISWSELPSELTSLILHRLGAFEMLETAQKVCKSWRDVCKDPSMWRKIDMRYLRDVRKYYDLGKMCRHAVDRSQGGLVQIEIWFFGTDELLNYIADSSRNLRSLKIAMCSSLTNYGFAEAVGKLPLLEDLEVSYCRLSAESMEVVGKSCPNLKTLKLNRGTYRYAAYMDDDALTISETMPGLHHLQLFGNRLSNTGLNAILENCPNLEHLDLRQCFKVELDGDLKKRCSESIKVVRQPYDSTHDYPYHAIMDSREYYYESDYDDTSGDDGNDYDQYDNPDYDQYDNSDYDEYDIFVR